MRRALMIIGLIFALSVLAACGGTLMGSVSGNLSASGGSAYCLPKAVLDVKLSDIDSDLVLAVSDPIYVPDERFTYLLEYRPNILSSDTVELTVDPKTNLLQTFNGTAEDKTSQIITQLAEAGAMIAFKTKAQPGETVIFERSVDPADDSAVAELRKAMNAVATGHAENMYQTLNCESGKENRDKCHNYDILRKREDLISFVIRKPSPLTAEPADCSLGVCYRVPAPYGIEFTFNNQYSYGAVVNLPNARPAIVLPLKRRMFVKMVDNAVFENGMLKMTHYEKPSEALEVASLPVTVATGIFSSVSTLIQAKIDISDKEKSLAQHQAAESQAKKNLQDKQTTAAQDVANKKTGVLLSGSSSGRRFSTKQPDQ
jgi:hypothetical protein